MATKPKMIMCSGNNKRIAEIAIQNSWLYGARLPGKACFPLYFADQDWKKPNRTKYIEALKKERPVMATVLDIESKEQYSEVLEWVHEIAEDVSSVQEIIVIPKVSGIIDKIPNKVHNANILLGYSVPTKYGATNVPLEEFRDRPVHLLGGSPNKQIDILHKLNVYSLDGNMSWQMSTRFCKYWYNRKWIQLKDYGKDAIYASFNLSMKNIMEYFKCMYK